MPSKDEKNNFSIMIEARSIKNNTKIMETIIEHCEETGLEPEVAGLLINNQLKTRIEEEARALSMMKKKRR